MVVHERDGHKEIAVYIVAAGEFGPLQRGSVAELLSNRLPDYMQPRYLEVLELLPRTTGGKIDRKALPAPSKRFRFSGSPAQRTEERS